MKADEHLRDDQTLVLIGDGASSDIEVADEENEENRELREYVTPRIPLIEEEVVKNEDFQNDLNNLNAVNDIIGALVRGDIGLKPLNGDAQAFFEYIKLTRLVGIISCLPLVITLIGSDLSLILILLTHLCNIFNIHTKVLI